MSATSELHVRLGALRDEHCYITSTDGCCHCGNGECDGVSCIAALDPNDDESYEAIENLHTLLREGQAWRVMHALMDEGERPLFAWRMADEALAIANNQTVTERCEQCGQDFEAQGPCDDTCTACRILNESEAQYVPPTIRLQDVTNKALTIELLRMLEAGAIAGSEP